MKNIVRTAISLLLMLVCVTSFAIDKSQLKRVKVGNRDCYEYEAQKGETLYGISKSFGVTQEEIIELNEKAQKGVKKGMKLKVPVKSDRLAPKATVEEKPKVSRPATHVVVAKETLYGIGRRYGISQKELMDANPGFDGNLKEGQVLNIPQENQPKVVVQTAGVGRMHIVQPKETLYGISRQYSVTMEQLTNANPELKNRMPRVGEVLTIPVEKKSPAVEPVAKPEPPKEPAQKPIVHQPTEFKVERGMVKNVESGGKLLEVALMMPFMLDDEGQQDQTLNKFVEFYEGVLIGLGELKEAGYSVRLNVYDVEKTADKLESVLRRNPSIAHSDLIIGPAYGGQVGVLSRYSHHHGIPLVVPFTKRVAGIGANPYVFQYNGNVGCEWSAAADMTIKEMAGKDVVLVNFNNDVNDEGSEFTKYIAQSLKQYGITHKVQSFSRYTFSQIGETLASDKETVLVLGTKEGTLVRDLIGEVERWRKQGKKVTIFGFDNWGESLLNECGDVMYYSRFHIDKKSKAYSQYNAKMHREFGYTTTQNPRFDLLGRDLIVYFVKNFTAHGKTWSPSSDVQGEELQSRFSWRKVGKGGYVNQGCYLIKK